MTLEEKLRKASWESGLSKHDDIKGNALYLSDALTICQEAIDEAKIEENEYWVKYSYGLSKFGDTAIYAEDFNNRIKELKENT